MTRVISSRPDEEEGTLSLHALSVEELELISALVCCIRLGRGNKYREAAFQLIDKIENIRDDKFMLAACDTVDFHVEIMDANGNRIDRVSHNFLEITIP
jgi:hypothetical protein